VRAFKLFALGLATQGSLWDADSYTYGFNMATIRWCGILQRIAWAYIITAAVQLYVPQRTPTSSSLYIQTYQRYRNHFLVCFAFVLFYALLTFTTHVPSYHIELVDGQYGCPDPVDLFANASVLHNATRVMGTFVQVGESGRSPMAH
jgi:heparan-alpha-glucosaminide N-acetyltransferase